MKTSEIWTMAFGFICGAIVCHYYIPAANVDSKTLTYIVCNLVGFAIALSIRNRK